MQSHCVLCVATAMVVLTQTMACCQRTIRVSQVLFGFLKAVAVRCTPSASEASGVKSNGKSITSHQCRQLH